MYVYMRPQKHTRAGDVRDVGGHAPRRVLIFGHYRRLIRPVVVVCVRVDHRLLLFVPEVVRDHGLGFWRRFQ